VERSAMPRPSQQARRLAVVLGVACSWRSRKSLRGTRLRPEGDGLENRPQRQHHDDGFANHRAPYPSYRPYTWSISANTQIRQASPPIPKHPLDAIKRSSA
jgi:hypothetical protein